MRIVALALTGMFCLAVVGPAKADDGCGKADCRGKTCRVVCTMKEVKKTIWTVQCESVCPVLPGCCRERGCSSCGACDVEGCGKTCSCGATPHCGKARTVKKLVKKEITCHVPVYKCVAADCGGCGWQCEAPAAAPTQTHQAYEPAPLPRQ